MASADLREELTCSICLDLYKKPVSLKCGHNFCRDCIVSALDTQKPGHYSCPECREQYTERPPLEKNRKLSNIVDRFRSTNQEKTEIFCTYCDPPEPATKTCLQCEASFCDKHLKNHSKSADHIITDPTTSFEGRKCSTHNEILKYYCPKDGCCICMSCLAVGDHKGHDVELLNEASEKKKEKLRDITKNLKAESQETEESIQNLQKHLNEEKGKATDVTKRVTELFMDIRKQTDDVERRILAEVFKQEEQISQSVVDLIQQLELHKDQLSWEINITENLHGITDPITMLKEDFSSYDVIPRSGDVRDAGRLDEEMISQILHRELLNFTDSLIDLKMKRQFSVMEKSNILLDIKTACNYITISKDHKSATFTNKSENRPDVPERFNFVQVLNTVGFSSGRHYWEVDVSGAQEWLIGVAAHSIERKIDENESYIGYNDKSWGLTKRKGNQSVKAVHNDTHTVTDCESSIKVIGVYLDYEADCLSFYKMCDPVMLLHTFTATFSEPLHAAFYVFKDSTIKIK